VNEQIEYFVVIATAQKIKIIPDIVAGVYINGEKQGLQDLVANLVSNSVKYISNKREISIGLHARGNIAVLTVEDTGLGIPKEDMPNLFQRFYRPHMEGRPDGTGLGLAICNKIVQIHGGKIAIESELGKGTKVTVELKKIHPPGGKF
jgi:signal transduction histidine kinase